MFIQKGGVEEVKRAAENRKRDLLVYVALANLRKRVPFGHLSQSLRFDIHEFFGNYTVALQKGMELLYAAGDPGEIEVACEGLKVGWQDEQALYIHRSVLDELPPVLRAYVGCATALFGDVSQTDVIKLHKSSGKVTFLGYDDFESKPLPELRNRITRLQMQNLVFLVPFFRRQFHSESGKCLLTPIRLKGNAFDVLKFTNKRRQAFGERGFIRIFPARRWSGGYEAAHRFKPSRLRQIVVHEAQTKRL